MRKALLFLLVFLCGTELKSQSLYFPPLSGNTWDTIAPSSLGWCQPETDSLLDYLGSRNTKAFLVLKDGKIVIEQYYGTFTRDSSWYWASAGKSLTAVLTGIAQQEGFLSINDTSSQYLGTGWTSAPQAKEDLITVRNQLSMTTGLDDTQGDPDCTDDTCLLYLADAGTRWAYHNAPYTLLDGVLQNATGTTLNNYVAQKLTATTGMTGLYVPVGYNNVFISRARSFARFGLLMLNHGNWNGQQILDSAFHYEMTHSSQQINPSYGYLWWLNGQSSFMLPGIQFSFNGPLSVAGPPDMYAALGKNGQILNVVPSQNLIVIRMGDVPLSATGFVPNLFNDTIWQKLNAAMCSTTSLSEMLPQPQIYPNPSGGNFRISLPGERFAVLISDMHGRYIPFEGDYTDMALVNVDLPSGLYNVEVICRSKIIHRKIVIH